MHSMIVRRDHAMPTIGVLTLELHLPDSHSLKDKRSVVKGLKDRLRHRFNVSVAEIGGHDTWQRSVIAAVTVVLGRLEPAAPTVDRGVVWRDTVASRMFGSPGQG